MIIVYKAIVILMKKLIISYDRVQYCNILVPSCKCVDLTMICF